jgi:hypothetical protein
MSAQIDEFGICASIAIPARRPAGFIFSADKNIVVVRRIFWLTAEYITALAQDFTNFCTLPVLRDR